MPRIKEAKAAAESVAKLGGDKRIRIPDGLILLGIDPGDVHVGVAAFAEDELGVPRCDWATEYGHDEATDFVQRQIAAGTIYGIALERFTLYEDQAQKQVGSEFLTCEQIGVIKYLVRVNNLDCVAGSPWAPNMIRLWIQGADIKKPTRKQISARGIDSVADASTHAKDAELHGWYRVLRGEDNP